jgi:hypothetical protein
MKTEAITRAFPPKGLENKHEMLFRGWLRHLGKRLGLRWKLPVVQLLCLLLHNFCGKLNRS